MTEKPDAGPDAADRAVDPDPGSPVDHAEHADPVEQVDRERAAMRLRAAVDEGSLDVAEAGRRLAGVHRVSTRGELRALTADLGITVPVASGDRQVMLRAAVRIVLLALVTAVVLFLLLHGGGPLDGF